VDCDDADAGVGPGEADVPGEAVDRDCDGLLTCFADVDGDGDGSATLVSVPVGGGCDTVASSAVSTDCDDADPGTSGLAQPSRSTEVDGAGVDHDCDGVVSCFRDVDDDGFGVATVVPVSVSPGAVGGCLGANVSVSSDDCDDGAVDVSPGSTVAELPADGVDRDCDGSLSCYADVDGDGVGDGLVVVSGLAPGSAPGCDQPATPVGPTASTDGDCDDADATTFPGAPEPAGGADDLDCDGRLTCFADADGDGFGGVSVTTAPVGFQGGAGTCAGLGTAVAADDCDDADGATFPGAPEVVGTGQDRDCDGDVRCFADGDGDGFGTASLVVRSGVPGASVLPGCVDASASGTDGDCLDCDGPLDCGDPILRSAAAGVNPVVTEVLGNPWDDDCSGTLACWDDDDDDGFGDEVVDAADPSTWSARATSTLAPWGEGCDVPSLASVGGDCHDDEPAARPGGTEVAGNDLDDDCDGVALCLRDADGDGVPAAADWDGVAFDGTSWSSDVALTTPGATVPWGGCRTGDPGCVDPRAAGERYVCEPSRGEGHGVPSGEPYDCFDHPSLGAAVFPGAPEVDGAGIDANCDGLLACFVDDDGDGWGGTPVAVDADFPGFTAGWRPAGLPELVNPCTSSAFAQQTGDCHDDNPGAFPQVASAERPGDDGGRAFDEDCSGTFLCYGDGDGDGWGASLVEVPTDSGVTSCARPDLSLSDVGGVPGQPDHDCHDDTSRAHPGLGADDDVVGSDLDEDCDGELRCRPDGDGDGVGIDAVATVVLDWSLAPDNPVVRPDEVAAWDGSRFDCGAVEGLSGRAEQGAAEVFDCHDDNDEAAPGRVDQPGAGRDGLAWDEDCDGVVTCFRDRDGDGVGTVLVSLSPGAVDSDADGTIAGAARGFACDQPAQGWASVGGDCHDDDAASRPGGTEVVDARDNDCDGDVACYEDLDRDGFGTALRQVPAAQLAPVTSPVWEGGGAASQGLVLRPCDAVLAEAEDLPDAEPWTTELSALADQRFSRRGGAGTDAYDCHDDWPGAHPGQPERAGNPWDDDCDGRVRCFVDADGDGFGSRATFEVTVRDASDALLADLDLAFADESTYPWPGKGVLTAWPQGVFDGLDAWLDGPNDSERDVLAAAETTHWYDCQLAGGGDGAALGEGDDLDWGDCHDDAAEAWPAHTAALERVPLDDHPVDDGTCAGVVLCVTEAGIVDDPVCPGVQRCFAPRERDPGEIAGDALDNDCDGVAMCWSDLDGDGVGTVPVLDDGVGHDPTAGVDAGAYVCTDPGEAVYAGDCHDDAPDVRPPVRLEDAVAPGGDLSAAIDATDGAAVSGPASPCAGVVLCLLTDGSVSADPACTTQDFRCYDEVAGDPYDQDCDGVVACLTDDDGDG
jgi:hypothetical protein